MKTFMRKHRVFALLACVLMTAMLLLNMCMIVCAAEHCCVGMGCETCKQVATVENALGMMVLALLAWAAICLAMDQTENCPHIQEIFALPQRTLVAENVRLNN